MSFLHPEFIYYMLLPFIIIFVFLLTQKESQEHFFSKEVMDKLKVSANTLTLKARNALFMLMGLLIIIALAQPVIKDGTIKVKAKSADIMIALDISDSMLATDIYPNRLEMAKQKALTLLDESPNERIGVVAFAKNSYLVSPLSFDTAAVAFLLRQLDTTSITEKGTDLLSILDVVSKTQKKQKKKYLLILSDGGDKGDFTQEVEMAKENNIIVFILGVATKKGAPIKLKDDTFIKHNGNIIVSKLNEKISALATKTGGVYIQSTTASTDIKTMLKEITSISEEKEFHSEDIPKYTPLFYYPLGLALLILLIATSSFGKRGAVNTLAVMLCLLFVNPNAKAGILDFMELSEAKEAYENGEFERSAKIYKKIAENTNNPYSYFNAGNSFYKQKKYKEAVKLYEKAVFQNKEYKAKKLGNLGNAHAKQITNDNLLKAKKYYEESLKLVKDKNIEDNLEKVKKLIEKKKEEKRKENSDEKSEDKDKKDSDSKDSKDGGKKESDEKQDKNSDEKNDSKDESDSSKSKESKDKEKSSDEMKSKKEKEKNSKSKDDKDKEDAKKESIKEIDKDKKNGEKDSDTAPKELENQTMSEAEEKKWIEQLNMNKNTYLYQLNNDKTQKNYNKDEKPW
ncbi:MAG: VWA domain-containing protein [Sulfurimonas sp.]|nr:VWA domain-containing protein [Sulfurimonas sp.]